MVEILRMTAYLSAIGLSLYTAGWLLKKADRNRTTRALTACQFLIIIWCIPQLFTALPMTKGEKYLAYAVSYVGISFIGPAWLKFSSLYCGYRLKGWLEWLLFSVSAVNYSMMLTNETHHLFYRVFEITSVVYGPVFTFHMCYTYLCVLAGMGVLLVNFKKNRVAPAHIAIIILSAAIPLGFNLLYLSKTVQSGFDLTPPAFALSSLLMLLAVFRYDFLDVNPMAFEKIFAEIGEAVVVYNRRGKITYLNRAAAEWFGIGTGDTLDQLPAENEMTLQDGRRVERKQYLYHDRKGRLLAGNVMFTDVGKYYELLRQGRELAVSNQKLALEMERNRIAQEVHDTVGHTLTMIHSLIRLLKAEYGDSEYLEQAQRLSSEGIRELRCSIQNLRRFDDREMVSQGIMQLARQVKEIEVEVEIKGEESAAYSYLSPVVYDCVREAITNCLRYAGATHMDVIVKFMEGSLGLYLFDNGRGCEEIREGNGIRGIRERVEKNGGQVRFLSAPGEGFQISIRFPVTGEVTERTQGGTQDDQSSDSG